MSQRRFSRGRLTWMSAGALVVAAAVLTATTLASAAGPVLPRRTPAQLLVAVRGAKLPSAMSGVITETANLGFPALPNVAGLSSSLLSASALLTGTHTADFWYAGPRQVRIALPVSFGETDLRVNGQQVWLWDSHTQMATHYILPAPLTPAQLKTARQAREKLRLGAGPGSIPAGCGLRLRQFFAKHELGARHQVRVKHLGHSGFRKILAIPCVHRLIRNRVSAKGAAPMPGRPGLPGFPMSELTPQQAVNGLLAAIGPTTKVSVIGTAMVAGRAAYQLEVVPRAGQSLISKIVIAVDAHTSLPLQLQVFAKGTSSPAFQLGYTSLSFAKPAASNFTFTPPAGAHVKTERLPRFIPGIGLTPGFGLPRIPQPVGPGAPAGKSQSVIIISPGTGRQLASPPPVPTPPDAPVPGTTPLGTLPGGQLPGGKLPGSQAVRQTHLPNLRPAAGPRHHQVLGTGWLSVAVIPAPGLLAGKLPVHAGHGQAASQLAGVLGVLLKAATPVHGTWGSGKLLRTTLFSVLITSKGQLLIGAVTPAVLYADAAKITAKIK